MEALVFHKSIDSSGINAMSLADTFERLLSVAILRPHYEVSRMDCIGEVDEALIRRRNKHIVQPLRACLHDSISFQATSRPSALAVCAVDGNFTYEELDKLSSHLAKTLVKRCLGSGSIISLCFEKSKYMIIAMLAVFKSGAACTMLEPSLPTERLMNLIRDTPAVLTLLSSSQKSRFQGLTDTLEVNADFFERETGTDTVVLPPSNPSDVAIVLFTSGSTGVPKGILHDHISINTNLHALARWLRLDESTRVAQFAAYSFDLSMIEILLPLIVGGCVCIPSEGSRLDDLSRCFEDMGVTFAMLTPSSIKLLQPHVVRSMKMIMVGGEPVTNEVIRVWKPHVTLINAWGTSECGICSCAIVDPSLPTSIGSHIRIGAWIVNPYDAGRLLPIGAVGELVVEGPQVALGYLAKPEKTLESFPKGLPWVNGTPRGRLYRTGDLMRYMSDGSMEYCGRKDSQIKVRGCRIEPGEIEYQITASSFVHSVMVTVPDQGIYRGKLVAILQLENNMNNDKPSTNKAEVVVLSLGEDGSFKDLVQTITGTLESKLPSQSVPEKWIIVDRLAITKSDKVNRKEMNTWLSVWTPATQTPGITPMVEFSADPTLREIGRILVGVTSLEDGYSDKNVVSTNSSLRDYGINSLSAVALSAALQRSFKVQIPMKVLLDPSLTITDVRKLVEKSVLSRNMGEPSRPACNSYDRLKSCRAVEDFQQMKSKLLEPVEPLRTKPGRGHARRVLLTGATGYVGSYILRSLLACPHVSKVCVLVRASTQEFAFARIIGAAKTGKWWNESLLPKLEVWLGDLSQPNLGLSTQHINRLKSCTNVSESINSIVHNGAIVHWLADYEELRPTNVSSTGELLDIVRSSSSISSFVYISSDPETQFDEALWEEAELINHLSQLNGYRQTKAVSELLVSSMALAFASTNRHFFSIKPGFVVGSQDNGVTNVDDFLWRLSASVLRLNAYDSSATGWLYVASVDVIANTVLEALEKGAAFRSNTVIADGMNIDDFWGILENESGRILHPLPHDEWLVMLRQDILETGSQHPLWPLLSLLEDDSLTLQAANPPSSKEGYKRNETSSAIRKGLAQLSNLGLLSGCAFWPRENTPGQLFQRTRF